MKFRLAHTFLVICQLSLAAVVSESQAATVTPVQPAASFDFGEGAINSFLARRYTQPFTVGAGGEQVTFDVIKATVDFESGTAAINLDMAIKYDLLGSPKTARVRYKKTMAVSQLSYTLSQAKVLALLSDIAAAYQSLPAYVRTQLENQFKDFPIYAQNLIEKVGHPPSGAPVQPDSRFPVFFQGEVVFSATFLQNLVRFSAAPKLEIENMEIVVHRGLVNGDRFKNSFTIKTNYSGTVERVRIHNSLGSYTYDNSTVYNLVRNGTGRNDKFQCVINPSMNSNFPTTTAYFTAIVSNGVSKLYVRGTFAHGTTSTGNLGNFQTL